MRKARQRFGVDARVAGGKDAALCLGAERPAVPVADHAARALDHRDQRQIVVAVEVGFDDDVERAHRERLQPDYRGRGIGKKTLLAGLHYLQSKGVRVVKLTVDSENKSALALYSSVGFKPQTVSLWYEKVID